MVVVLVVPVVADFFVVKTDVDADVSVVVVVDVSVAHLLLSYASW